MNLLVSFKGSSELWKLKIAIIFSFYFSETDRFRPAQIATPSFERNHYWFQSNKAFYLYLSFTEKEREKKSSDRLSVRAILITIITCWEEGMKAAC